MQEGYEEGEMASALNVVKKVYSCFSKGDQEGFLNLCAENIEWVVNGPSALEKCRAFQGRDGVREFLGLLGKSWEYRSFEAKEFITEGNTVVVLGDETGRDKTSNRPFENRWAHVFDVEGGQIIRFREFLCHWSSGHHPPKMSWTRAPR